MKQPRPFIEMIRIADGILTELYPHCDRIEIAGSVRRRKQYCSDIEIVCIPKPYDTGMFASGIAQATADWPIIRGKWPCKYTSRTHPAHKVQVDIFTSTPDNFGLIHLIRTGPAAYSSLVMKHLKRNKYPSVDGRILDLRHSRAIVPVPNEEDVFRLAQMVFVKPEFRF